MSETEYWRQTVNRKCVNTWVESPKVHQDTIEEKNKKDKNPERESVRSWLEKLDSGQVENSIWSQPLGFQHRKRPGERERDYLISPSLLPPPESTIQNVTHKYCGDSYTNDWTNWLGWESITTKPAGPL